jgi:hypothetical protein
LWNKQSDAGFSVPDSSRFKIVECKEDFYSLVGASEGAEGLKALTVAFRKLWDPDGTFCVSYSSLQ